MITAEVFRREPSAGFERYGPNRNVRVAELINPQFAPDPVRDSDFYADGKPWRNAWSHVQRFVGFNIAAIETQQEDEFSMGKHVFTNVMAENRGLQTALMERANIQRPESRAYGDMRTFDPRANGWAPAVGPYLAASVPH
jgi:hypothetical protein